MPCHFSGNGRSDFASSLSSATSTDSSPVLLLIDLAARADDVAQVPLLELAVQRLAEPVALDHELNLARAVLQPHEADAAADALDHQAPGDVHVDRRCGQRLGAVRLIRREQLVGQRIAPEIVRVRVAGLAQPRELRAPLRDQPDSPVRRRQPSLVSYRPCFKLSCRKSSRSPSSTFCGRALSKFVRKILHARLIEHVRADLAAPADVGLAVLDDLRLLAPLLLLELVELRAHLVHGRRAVLVLRALVLALHDDAGRNVRDADRGLRLVDVLAAGAARAEHVDAQIRGIQLDLDVVLDLGRHEHRGERRMPALTRIERRLAHEAMHAGLRAQPAVRILAANVNRRALDARDVAGRLFEHVDGITPCAPPTSDTCATASRPSPALRCRPRRPARRGTRCASPSCPRTCGGTRAARAPWSGCRLGRRCRRACSRLASSRASSCSSPASSSDFSTRFSVATTASSSARSRPRFCARSGSDQTVGILELAVDFLEPLALRVIVKDTSATRRSAL